jgi:hypothetical protein
MFELSIGDLIVNEAGDDRIDALFGVMNEVLENDYEN